MLSRRHAQVRRRLRIGAEASATGFNCCRFEAAVRHRFVCRAARSCASWYKVALPRRRYRWRWSALVVLEGHAGCNWAFLFGVPVKLTAAPCSCCGLDRQRRTCKSSSQGAALRRRGHRRSAWADGCLALPSAVMNIDVGKRSPLLMPGKRSIVNVRLTGTKSSCCSCSRSARRLVDR